MRVVVVLALAAWAVVATAGGGMDLGDGLGGTGPAGAVLGLAVGAVLAAAAAWLTRDRIARGGPAGLALACGLGVTLLSAASIAWALEPALAWTAANREALLLCGLVLGLAAAAAFRDAAHRFPPALALAAALPLGAALLTESLPGLLGTDGAPERLSAPVDYPNALALIAALALPGMLLWDGRPSPGNWGARIAGGGVAAALAVAVLTLSRSGIAACGVAALLTLALARPARPAAARLVAGAVGGVAPVVWALNAHGLSTPGLDAADRAGAGAVFGLLTIGGIALAALLAPPLTRLAGRARLPRPRTIAAVAAVLVALAPMAAVAADAGAIADCGRGALGNDVGRLTQVSANQRGAWWCEAADGWRAAPVAGNGAGSFPLVQLRYREDGLSRFAARDPHQVFLGPASSLGTLGLLLVLGLWAAAVWAVARLRGAAPAGVVALLAAAAVQSLTDWTLTWPAAGLPVLAAVGLLTATAAPPRPARRPSALGEAALAAGLLAVVVVAAASAAMPWLSDRAWRSGQDALGAGDPAAALRDAHTARDRNPLALRPLQLEAVALASLGRRADAVEALREGTRVQPDNPQAWKALALAQRRDPAAARVAWIRVHLLDPRDPDALGFLRANNLGPADAASARRGSAAG